MQLFSPTRSERTILREHLEYLSLLDLETEIEMPFLPGNPLHQKTYQEHGVNLYLTPGFSIGTYVPLANKVSKDVESLMERMIVAIYERSWFNHITATINYPLPLSLGTSEYNNGIARSIVEATFARVAVMHLAPDEQLDTTIGAFPTLGIFDRTGLLDEFATDVSFPDNREVFVNFRTQEPNERSILRLGTRQGHEADIRAYLLDEDIRTLFVLPLMLGGIRRGYLAIGFDIDIHLSETLDLTFHGMASHAVAAAENYRKLQALDDLRNDLLRDYLTAVQVELLQGFRHVAGNATEKAKYAFVQIDRARDARTRHLEAYFDDLREALKDIGGALTEMRKIRDFANKFEEVDVFAVFDEAVQMASHLLQREKVQVRREKHGTTKLVANPGALRYAFSNLLLNSIQAFQDSSYRRDKIITLLSESTNQEIKLDLSDNGPGIRVGKGNIKKTDDIFLVGVTSKKDGTGYGLPFVRDVIQRLHRGSINVKRSDQGATFHIQLPITRGN